MKRIIVIAIVFCMVACQRELSFEVNGLNPENNLYLFFKRNKTAPQTFTANASESIRIGAEKTYVNFDANSFVKLNGAIATGNITLELVKIYTPAQMILNHMPTVSNGWPIISAGEFYVGASQNGEKLILAPGKLMKIETPPLLLTDSMINMQVFKGVPDTTGINWVIDSSAGNNIRQVDTAITGYELFAGNIEWINCDRFYNEPAINTNVDASLAPDDNVAVFVHFTGLNSVITMYMYNAFDKIFSGMVLPRPATIVAICYKNKHLFAAITETRLVENATVKLNFEPMSEDALKQRLQLLK